MCHSAHVYVWNISLSLCMFEISLSVCMFEISPSLCVYLKYLCHALCVCGMWLDCVYHTKCRSCVCVTWFSRASFECGAGHDILLMCMCEISLSMYMSNVSLTPHACVGRDITVCITWGAAHVLTWHDSRVPHACVGYDVTCVRMTLGYNFTCDIWALMSRTHLSYHTPMSYVMSYPTVTSDIGV